MPAAVAPWQAARLPCGHSRAWVVCRKFGLQPEGWLRLRPSRAEQLVGSASRAELANLAKAFGLALVEELAVQAGTLLQAAVAAQDALLAGQSRSLAQRTHKHDGGRCWKVKPDCKRLDRQALKATTGQLSLLGRCLVFRRILARVS